MSDWEFCEQSWSSTLSPWLDPEGGKVLRKDPRGLSYFLETTPLRAWPLHEELRARAESTTSPAHQWVVLGFVSLREAGELRTCWLLCCLAAMGERMCTEVPILKCQRATSIGVGCNRRARFVCARPRLESATDRYRSCWETWVDCCPETLRLASCVARETGWTDGR